MTQTMLEKMTAALMVELSAQINEGRAYAEALFETNGLTTIDGTFNIDDAIRAALQALREPTEEMKYAGGDVRDADYVLVGRDMAAEIFTAMIDAILQEKPKPL